MKRRKTGIIENQERWLLTYADLITLLLALFIVMYSMSRIDAGRFDQMSSALKGVLKGSELSIREKGLFAAADRASGGPMDAGQLRLMQSDMNSKVSQADLGESVSTSMTDRGLVIHIMEGALFREGQARLDASAREVLRKVGEEIRYVSNHIRVEGHTDPRPINTPEFPSNWELSAARATAVLRYLVDTTGIGPERISALGFGEFRPIVPNDTPEHMAQNRRVDIVVLNRRMSLSEPEGTAFPARTAPVATTGLSGE